MRSEYTSLNWAIRLVTLVTERDTDDDNMLISKQVQHHTAWYAKKILHCTIGGGGEVS